MPRFSALPRLTLLLALCLVAGLLAGVTRAHASSTQISMIEEDNGMLYDGGNTLQQLRVLGVEQIRMPMRWQLVAPNANSYKRPKNFDATNPASRGYNWATYDGIVKNATAWGISINFDLVGGAPLWATGRGAPGRSNWEPNATEFGRFAKAAAIRYSGNYDPALKRLVPHDPNDLPRVSSWSIWNEPDYGPSLAPQGLPGHLTIEHSPAMYRDLVDQAWSAFQHTGHGHDTFVWGELAPRGRVQWGIYSGMMPVIFLRAMYCVDAKYRPLRGTAARLRGCPTTAAGSRKFRSQHPALFKATGVSDHPYMRWYPPNHEVSPDPAYHNSIADYTSLGTLGTLERTLDRLQRVYGSRTQFPIYDTEFGYITNPPKRRWKSDTYPWVSTATAAYYLNWGEYIHWRSRRIRSYMQYLLRDPVPSLKSNDYGGFASGLEFYNGKKKPGYYAYRLPLYMPVTSARRGHALEVWGCVRPARFALQEGAGPQTAEIQAAPGANPSDGAFRTVATVTVGNPNDCYFDVHVPFPGSGRQTVRLLWRYPASDPLGYFDPLTPGAAAYSRHIQIQLH
jgi:hypothetical protein